MSTEPSQPTTSAEETIARFDSAPAAEKYSNALNHTATHRREVRCILSALRDVPRGASVLDLPCGTGRLLPALIERGFRVISADSSSHMVQLARRHALDNGLPAEMDDFIVASVFQTPFADDQFDSVVCNRLFHHFREAEVRRKALRELKRICRGPIVVSFFCSASWDGMVFHLREALRRDKATDRIPIPRRVFEEDVQASGMSVVRWLPIRPGVSKQWYAMLSRNESHATRGESPQSV